MRVLILAVGKVRNPSLSSAIADYQTRASRYWPIETHEVREELARSSAPDLVREREGERLRAKVPHGASLVACDPRGKGMSSAAFATWLQQTRERACDVAFLIGGAFGLSDAVKARSTRLLSLAAWTLPHELARLVLMEQLYRAGTIVRAEPYNK